MYLWAVSIDGEQTVRGNKADLDISFSDIWDNLDGALIFHFEGLYDQQLGFFTDLNYIALDPKESTPAGDVEIDFTEILFEFGGYYRFTRGIHAIDALLGLRYSSMDIDVDLPGPLPELDQSEDWVDPFVGLRWSWQMAEKWGAQLRGDLGGFGIGSDFTWNLYALVNYHPWKHVGIFGGYRVLDQDYSTGSGNNEFAFDATMQGPVVGLNITW